MVAKSRRLISMTIALRHPIKARFLRNMLEEYPTFLDSWKNKTDKEFSEIAKESSGGDRDVEASIYASMCNAFNDDDVYKENEIYQFIFLICHSYYEGCVANRVQTSQ
jgi:hypothetical protein